MIFADYGALGSRSVVSAARTGDIVLYASAERDVTNDPPSGWLSRLLSMTPCAIALVGDGVRDSRVRLDRVAIVIESRAAVPELLMFNKQNVLVVTPLERMRNRPICLRPLFTESAEGNDKKERSRRGAVHQLLLAAVDDLVTEGKLPARTLEQAQQSSAFLCAFLLHRAAVLPIEPEKFCGATDDVEQLFGADALHLDRALLREFAYGHQIWYT
jgi:hypothetical protein